MKHIKKLLVLFLAFNVFTSCEKEEETSYVLQDVSAPTNVNVAFDISNDEEGTVTLTPTAEGATEFKVYFGDSEGEEPTTVSPGETISHTYAEGEYNLRIVAVGLTGLTSELIRVVNISFGAPSELDVNIEKSSTNLLEIIVTPTAVDATVYDIYFGDAEDEEPTTIMDGESANHIYAEEGDYAVRVVARGAGAATVEYSEEISVTAAEGALKLPITFDDATVNYAFETFNGTSFEIVDNPQLSGINSEESMVGALTNSGAAFEGMAFQLGEPVDFGGENKTITLKLYSEVEVPVLLKFENGVDAERANEVVANHTGSGWEELSFDFATNAKTSYISESDPGGEAFVPTGQYASMVIFIDGPGTTAGTFYLDDGMKAEGESADPFKLPVTFDSFDSYGEDMVFGFGGSFELVANPFISGTNDSDSNVGSFTKAGGQFEGLTFALDEAIDLSTDDKTMSLKLYSEEPFTILFKFETGVNGERSNEVRANHTGSGWETLTFDFATDATKSYIDGSQGVGEDFVPTGQYDSFSIFFDFEGSLSGIYYIDDIIKITDGGDSTDGGTDGDGTDSGPTAAAPNPSAPEANVIPIFSDAYTNPAGVNYYPNWGQETTYEMVSIDGGSAIKYSNLNYQGIVIGENVDATGYEFIHIDVWSGDYTSLPFFLISGSGEKSVTLNLTANEWNSIDIPLSDFTDQGLSIEDVKEFKFDVQPDNGGTIYIDNLYFYKSSEGGSDGDGDTDNTGGDTSGVAPNSPIDFEAGGYGANWTWTVFENETNPALEIVSNPSATGINTSTTVAKFTALQAGQSYAGVESKRGEDIGDFTFDETNSTVKIMVYKSVISDVGLKFSEANGEAQTEVKVANTKINEWEELTFDLSGSIGQGATGVITQIIIFPDFQDRTSDNVIYFDNITFGSN